MITILVSANNSDMTDGCGFSNLALHISIYHQHLLEAPPTAFQFRLGGSKVYDLNLQTTIR